jgi:hyperosmotically inducible protein
MSKVTIVLSALVLMLAVGCKKKAEHSEGPMESAGEEVDVAADNAGDKVEEGVEEAGDKVEDATD